jgi:hypothetical protein
VDTGEKRRRAWIWVGLSAVVVAGLVAVLWIAPEARGADGPHMTLPPTCSLLDRATLSVVMPADITSSGEHPGLCHWKPTTGANTMSVSLQTELAFAGAGSSAVDNAHRIFPFHGSSNAVDLAGLADEAAVHVYYEGSTSEAAVTMRAANMNLRLSYQDDRAQPGYLAEIAEVLARQALRNAVGDTAGTGSTGRQASTRSVEEVVRGKHPLEPAEARYRPQPSRAVAPPSWRPGDETAVMGFFDEFAFKVPQRARCDFLGTHWRCVWAVPGESLAAVDISLRHCRHDCQDDWPFRAVEAVWRAEDPASQVSTETSGKLKIDGVTYRDHVQISMKHTTPGYRLSVQVVVPERHATTAQKIVNDIRFQAA